MARPGIPYEIVNAICNRLDADGAKPSYRLVALELDGTPSKKTVLEHIERWRSEQTLSEIVPGLSDSIVAALKLEIAEHVRHREEQSTREKIALKEQNKEALDELDNTEEKNQELEDRVQQLETQLAEQKQKIENLLASTASTIEQLEHQVNNLTAERKQLIESGEAARTGAARAQLQLEQANKTVLNAEKREAELNKKMDVLISERIEFEKASAVANVRVDEVSQARKSLKEENLELKESLKDATREYRAQDQEHKATVDKLTTVLDNTRNRLAQAEQRVAVLETQQSPGTKKTTTSNAQKS